MADILNKLNSANYVTVKVTDNAIVNGNNLLAAYSLAKSTNPNGIAKSATNRLNIILPVAIYDLGTQSLTLDAEYIDIIGSTSDTNSHYIKTNNSTGVIIQTANDVDLYNLKIQNIGSGFDYFPNSDLPLTYLENIFFAGSKPTPGGLSSYLIYSGKYVNCSGGNNLFGSLYGHVNLSGSFLNCVGGDYSFGGRISSSIYSSVLSGQFTNCTAGNYSFGNYFAALSLPNQITGNFRNCKAGDYSFCGDFISAILKYCTAGDFSFLGALTSTDFEYCSAGNYSFGIGYNINLSKFKYCKAGDNSFGGRIGFAVGSVYGDFINCIGEGNSFGSAGPNVTINENSKFINCFGCNPYSKYGTYINCSVN